MLRVATTAIAIGLTLTLARAEQTIGRNYDDAINRHAASEVGFRERLTARGLEPARARRVIIPGEIAVSQIKPTTTSSNFDFICRTLSSAAQKNELPVAFLTRLIWQESRFDAHAVSPAGARGIAQFMPGTAAYFGLADAFDVSDAINKSAEFLRDLKREFGNLGLAAAAYNAGPRRIHEWIQGGGSLASETEAYVLIVTGHRADEWRSATPSQWNLMIPEAVPCPDLVKLLSEKPEQISSQRMSTSPLGAAPVAAVWGLQLIGNASRTQALAEFYKMQKTYKSALGGHLPLVLSSNAGRGHFWYRIRVAAESLFNAERLCSNLRAVGGRCLVQLN